MALRLGCIFLASGFSKRFRENKLLSDLSGRPLIDVVLGNHPCELFSQTVVVTRYAAVAVSAAQYGYTIVENDDPTGDISQTIRLGLAALRPGINGCMFSVCDQPLLTAQSVHKLVSSFQQSPDRIAVLSYHGKRGNPVLFPQSLFEELASLPAGQAGSAVINAHRELLTLVPVDNRRELIDIDYRSDLDILQSTD